MPSASKKYKISNYEITKLIAKGGMGELYVNGEKVGEGRIPRTQPMIFSADETADVGIDLATPVVERIGSERASKFTGQISKVVVEVRDG